MKQGGECADNKPLLFSIVLSCSGVHSALEAWLASVAGRAHVRMQQNRAHAMVHPTGVRSDWAFDAIGPSSEVGARLSNVVPCLCTACSHVTLV